VTSPGTAAEAPGSRWSPRRRWGGLLLLLGVAAAAASVLGVGFGRDPSVVPSALVGRPAPPLAGPTLSGGHLDLSEHRGKVLLVNVWASWCEACKKEHPVLVDAQRRLGPRGLQVIGIDMSDTKAAAHRFLDQMGGANYPSVFDPDARIAASWGTFGIPETYLVNRAGIVVDKVVGPVDRAWLRTQVEPRLSR